jgi:hypothetical protein
MIWQTPLIIDQFQDLAVITLTNFLNEEQLETSLSNYLCMATSQL